MRSSFRVLKLPQHHVGPVCFLQVGLSRVLELTSELLQYLQGLMVALLYQAESLRETTLRGIIDRAAMLADMRPIRQVRELPVQVQQVLRDLQELSKIVLQLVINTTPLYNMVSPERRKHQKTHLKNT